MAEEVKNVSEVKEIVSRLMEILKKPFPSKDVQWRIGKKNKSGDKAIVLAYIDARAIQERFDEAFDTWSPSYEPVDMGAIDVSTYSGKETKPIKGFVCTIEGVVDGITLKRADGGDCTDFEPFKGGLSSAFKRAASAFGVGRYLYDLGETWVDLDQYGKFAKPQLPDWALPEEERGKAVPSKKKESNAVVDAGENKCVACGVSVTENVAKFTMKKFNKVLCFNCQKKEMV